MTHSGELLVLIKANVKSRLSDFNFTGEILLFFIILLLRATPQDILGAAQCSKQIGMKILVFEPFYNYIVTIPSR